jgi:ABC-2 type transport system ATP-binding protein
MESSMIKVQGLTKFFQNRAVVSDVDLEVRHGEIFGLLGPNAAGKTTTIRMMCGIIESDAGSVRIDGKDVTKVKGRFGYVSQHFGQYEELSVWENLRFYAQMYGVKDRARLEHLLERYRLIEFRDRAAGLLSGGYKRRLALVCALAHDPEVLFLDEPTAGIDPVTRKQLWDDFYTLSSEGKSLFVTTHYMEEAQRCHQLAFMAKGKIIARGTPQGIKTALGDMHVYSVKSGYNPDTAKALATIEGVELVNPVGSELRIVVKAEVPKERIETVLEKTGITVPLAESELDLEDVFIALTQRRES